MFSKLGHALYVPIKNGRQYNYDGKTPGYPWHNNTQEIDVNKINNYNYDVIIFQTAQHILQEYFLYFDKNIFDSIKHKIFIVHNLLADSDLNNPLLSKLEEAINKKVDMVVHISDCILNQWNSVMPSLKRKSIVIYHAIDLPDITATYNINKAVCAINNLPSRPESGKNEFLELKKFIDIDLYGVQSESVGGKGNIPASELLKTLAKYSVYINPTRNNPLPMTVLQAMSIGLPVIALNTGDLDKAITDGIEGFLCNSVDDIIDKYNYLINNKEKICQFGINAINKIKNKFSYDRFSQEWNKII